MTRANSPSWGYQVNVSNNNQNNDDVHYQHRYKVGTQDYVHNGVDGLYSKVIMFLMNTKSLVTGKWKISVEYEPSFDWRNSIIFVEFENEDDLCMFKLSWNG